MHDLEENKDSVYYLVGRLCRSILLQTEDVNNDGKQKVLNKLKILAYSILLSGNEREEEFEPERAWDEQIFAAKISSHAHNLNFPAFEEHLEIIKIEPYFNTEQGKSVVELLFALNGSRQEEYEVSNNMCTPVLLCPSSFTLHSSPKNNKHYPELVDYDLMNPKPRFFKGIQELKSNDNPYLPHFIFGGEKDQLAVIQDKFSPKQSKWDDSTSEITFTGMTKRLIGSSMRINTSALRLFPESINQPVVNRLKTKKPTQRPTLGNINHDNSNKANKQKLFSWNWEGLGCFGITCSKPFAGDASVTLLLQSYINETKNQLFIAKVLNEKNFIADLKLLTVGIQSDTFYHDDFIIFSMESNITIEGVLPATVKNLVTEFLECGTCYKRMQTMIMKRDYKLMFEGFMFKALCSAIDEYLMTFRQFVFAYDDEHIVGYYQRINKMMKQINCLSYTLAIHPKVDATVKPPMGSQFLGYLYREIMRLTENDLIAVLIYLLKKCCHVYFKHLQKWIYYGLLDDPCNELFIAFVDHYRENTKYFYDKAYSVRKEVVPDFFQNFEDQILQCGKYTMLLKAYDPNHPLFELDYPPISVCLSVGEIESLEATCKSYFDNARSLCSSPVTIGEVFETRKEAKRQFFQRMLERSRANLERWTDEQKDMAQAATERKKKLLEELSTQLQDARKRKILERKANVENELKYLREAEHIEQQRVAVDNINLRKRIEYYQELHNMITEKDKKNNTKLSLVIPPTVMLLPSPRTPVSTAGTEFESCFGDEEQTSEYEECISDDFIDKFKENEVELQIMSKTNHGTDKEENAVLNKGNQDLIINGGLKRSTSDVINSNDFPDKDDSLQRNRLKAMSGTNIANCMHWENNSVTHTRKEEGIGGETSKLRVLTEEFGIRGKTSQKVFVADVNLNLSENTLTDLQRNRRRMMQNDLFSEVNTNVLDNRSLMYLDLNSDRSRNRKKVLESEYNIITGCPQMKKANSVVNIPSDTPLTPMSTASDDVQLTKDGLSDSEADKCNGNISSETQIFSNSNNHTLSLKIDIQAEYEVSQEQELTTANTCYEPTPECALNTAGLMAKQGFLFPSDDKGTGRQQNNSVDNFTNHVVQLENGEMDSPSKTNCDNPYKRCEELIATNFKCSTSSPFMRLNMFTNNSSEIRKDSALTEFLTEFLQKSVIIPMSTHLELVNNEVMRMFLHDLKVLDHFRSLRNYFFMMDGEFGSIICDGIIGKLEAGAKPEKLLNYQILHSILDTALGASITGKDKNAENLSFIVSDVPDKFELSSPDVLNNLSLSYRINWPLNLILNPETLEQYANIFKYLVRVRRISWILERSYQILKENVKQHGKDILRSPQYRHVQLIRHKFYHFVVHLQNHITSNALQASWKTFKDELISAKSIEDIYRKHATYIKRILFLCMLNKRSAEFYNAIDNIFKISIRFYNNLKSREFKLKPGEEFYTHSRYEKLVYDEIEFNKFIKYTIYLGNKIVRHGYQAEIGEFINLINYNQYYLNSIY
ncbi:gamma-tubulin complex component 6 isoform X2 [Musca autumnalis]|uniref:gamma-tubulin complex component 6 isoform X2 n=1 Tax=Musca autumnalis TaxID=221902 RepID=UPI003CE90008